jgi:hypothetical protein
VGNPNPDLFMTQNTEDNHPEWQQGDSKMSRLMANIYFVQPVDSRVTMHLLMSWQNVPKILENSLYNNDSKE